MFTDLQKGVRTGAHIFAKRFCEQLTENYATEPKSCSFFLGLSGWNMTYAQPLDASKTVQKDADQQLQQAFEREFAYVQAENEVLKLN